MSKVNEVLMKHNRSFLSIQEMISEGYEFYIDNTDEEPVWFITHKNGYNSSSVVLYFDTIMDAVTEAISRNEKKLDY